MPGDPAVRPRTVAVLFTDLVGSTELASRIGERAYAELRRAHFATLRRAIDQAGGEEVKGLGDGLLAVLDSAAAALDCAVAMQQSVELESRLGLPHAIRVGVALGDVTFEEGDVYGTAVVQAARLVGVAQGGQILATAMILAASSGRCRAAVADRGALELKGLAEPLATCEVIWERLPGPTLPLPAVLGRTGRIFVGRDPEMHRLERCWARAGEGELRCVLIAGEPGVGKTRLACELAAQLHAHGGTGVGGRCDADLGWRFQPFVEALRHPVGHTPSPNLAPLLGQHGGELSRLVPELAAVLPGLPDPLSSDPDTERLRLFDAVATWLSAVSAERPVLFVLDDIQWAAKPTLLLLRHVLRSAEPLRLLVVATYRDTEIGRAHPLGDLLADLCRLDGVERISLAGLAAPAVSAFLRRAAGRELVGEELELATAVHRETEGNPLFLQQVVRHLIETGVIREIYGRWTAVVPVERMGLPQGVRDVIGRRLSRLSSTANRALAVAAVAGDEFEVPVVEHAGRLDEEAMLSALDEAVMARLVIETGQGPRYRFAHTLVRATLYEELTGARRAALHRRVGEAIERLHEGHLDDHLTPLAHHFARASARSAETPKAVTYAQRAGDRALAQLANDEAVAHYRQALALLDGIERRLREPRRVELLISLGEAQRRAGDSSHRATLLDAARLAQAQDDPVALARAALANNRGFFSDADRVDAPRLAVLEAAVEAGSPGDSGTRARLLASLAGELVFSPAHERRDRLADEALAMARRLDDAPTLGHVLAHRIPVLVQTAPADLFACVDQLGGVAARLRDPVLAFLSAWWGSISALTAGDAREAAQRLDVSARLAGEIRQPCFQWASLFLRSNLSRVTGELALAETQAREAYEIGRSAGIPDAFRVLGVNLLWIRHDQGRLAEIADSLARATAREHPEPLALAAHALVLCELGRCPEAQGVVDTLAPGDFATLPGASVWLYSLTLVAATCACLGDRRRAALLYQRLTPWGGLVAQCGAGSTGTVDHHLALLAGVLDRAEAAEGHFADAVRINRRIGALGWLARTRLEWGRMLIAAGRFEDVPRARALLGEALDGARDLGVLDVERRAAALLDGRSDGSMGAMEDER